MRAQCCSMPRPIDPSEAIRCLQQLCVAGELTRLELAEIARSEGLGVERAAAILELLVEAGLVENAHASYRLIGTPQSISIADVWAALDRPIRSGPGATTLADLLAWEAQLFEDGPTAQAA